MGSIQQAIQRGKDETKMGVESGQERREALKATG